MAPPQTRALPALPEHTLGVALANRQSEFDRVLEAAIQQAAAQSRVALDLRDADSRADVQIAQIRDLVATRVTAVIVVPVDAQGVVAGIKAANEAAVPVVTAGIAAAGGVVACHVAPDDAAGGRLAGEFLARAPGQRGEVALIGGSDGPAVAGLTAGFRQAISRSPGAQIIEAPRDGAGRQAAAARGLRAAHPKLRGIFALAASAALDALAAVESAGRQEEVTIVSGEATRAVREAIQRGSALKAAVDRHPEQVGEKAVAMAAARLKVEKVPERVTVDADLYTGEGGQ